MLPVRPSRHGQPDPAPRAGIVQRWMTTRAIADEPVTVLHRAGARRRRVRRHRRAARAGARPGEVDDDRVRAAVRVGRERGIEQDVGFGLRQLVDIA